jgi:DNA repair protein RadC
MKEAGKFLEIPVLDHIIYTDNGYYSFADEGIL